MNKESTTLNAIIEGMDNKDSELTDSDDDDKENSHFQFGETDWFQGMHQPIRVLPNKSFMFNQNFEKRIYEVLFKYNHTKEIKLDPRKGILLDNCYTMDLFCNLDLVENITKDGIIMTVQYNGGTLEVTHKAIVPEYKQCL